MFNMSCAIIACLKQEELYVKEWLDWHISIGVDHFYLCDNNDKDYEPKLQDVIKDYIDQGIVEVFDYSGVHPIQPICYNDIYQKYRTLYDWWLFIDIDEFLYLPAFNNNIKEYLNIIPKNKNRIYILWRSYGDNELIEYDNKPIQERFKNPSSIKQYEYIGKSLLHNTINIEINSLHILNHKITGTDVFF